MSRSFVGVFLSARTPRAWHAADWCGKPSLRSRFCWVPRRDIDQLQNLGNTQQVLSDLKNVHGGAAACQRRSVFMKIFSVPMSHNTLLLKKSMLPNRMVRFLKRLLAPQESCVQEHLLPPTRSTKQAFWCRLCWKKETHGEHQRCAKQACHVIPMWSETLK